MLFVRSLLFALRSHPGNVFTIAMKSWSLVAASLLLSVSARAELARHPKFGFPLYTNAPPGRQLEGQHKPASNPPMSPEAARNAFVVPPGFEVRLFASEPEVVNPVAMSFDARGRLWVLELYEYPNGRPGQPGRDRIKILEDTDADGVADKVSVFADGMTLATALLVGNGGVYVGEAPHLWFLEDTDGDGRADRKTEVLTGFGHEDRHELLNGFTWGPDGQIYMTHGVFTISKAKDPSKPDAKPVLLTAGVARLDPGTRKFEVFAEGTSNPWGLDFDRHGNAFVSACVIDHLFHLTPGGIYNRQAGQAPFPYAYGELPSIVDHKHHMAAYCGINVYQGHQWPAEWQGAAIFGNIHQNALNIDRLTPKGSTFVAQAWNKSGDFLTTPDGWFMPVSQQVGPDGALWVMDWYDKYPCYQNANADPEGVDRERGRIWRVVWTGDKPGKAVASRPDRGLDLERLDSTALVGLLKHPNVWHRRTAQRILGGRKDTNGAVHDALAALLKTSDTVDGRLAALWTLQTMGALQDADLAIAAADKEPAVRSWAARLIGARGELSAESGPLLQTLASDTDPIVRLGVSIAARQLVSGSLTIDTPPRVPVEDLISGPAIIGLFQGSEKGTDPTFEFLFWMAIEPIVAADPTRALGAYLEDGARSTWPFSAEILRKVMRRTCDLRNEAILSEVVTSFGRIPSGATQAIVAGLRGLLEGQRGKAIVPNAEAVAVVSRLAASSEPEVSRPAQQLGTLWGDAAALKQVLARIQNAAAPESDRIAAIQTAAQQKGDDALRAVVGLVASGNSDTLQVAAVRALQQLGSEDTGRQLLDRWSTLTPAVRAAVADLATARWQWRHALLQALLDGRIKRGEVPPTVVRKLAANPDDGEKAVVARIFGKIQSTPEEKLQIIAQKRKVVVEGPVDLEKGRVVAQRNCFVCHKLHGEGAAVGPELTGVGRSSLDALLHNVIHPNAIIGEGYENTEVVTRDDRTFNGRMVENTDTVVKLLMAGPTEVVLAKSDIQSVRNTGVSTMPESLEQIPDDEFRNLIWYILAPPQDGKPLTEERRRELIGL
ncbi:MAG: hypothetical protein RLZ45_2618 [Verrucomicrobiota bacterium]